MEKPEQPQPNEVCFLLIKQKNSLMPFWNRVMKDGGQLRHGAIPNSKILFKCMQTEYIEVIDEIASITISDETLFNGVKRAIQRNNDAATSMPSSQMEPINLLSPNIDERKPSAVVLCFYLQWNPQIYFLILMKGNQVLLIKLISAAEGRSQKQWHQ
jgi:hypothetical protein